MGGPSVFFNEVKNSGIASGETATASLAISKAVALCDPFGLKPAIQTGANPPLPGAATQADGPVPSAAATFAANALYYSGANAGQDGVALENTRFWDPITAAQASGGAFCCDALYYGADGLGRGIPTNDPPIVGVTKNSAFLPIPLSGDAMEREIAPGGVCTGEAANNAKMEGLSAAKNVKEMEMLEGQSFYACVAPSQYVLPKVNSVATTQAANAARQKKCSETITQMLKMNRATAGTSTSTATCVRPFPGQMLPRWRALARAFLPLTARCGWLESAVVQLLLHTPFLTHTATPTLALRTSPPLVPMPPSMGWQSSPPCRAARTCLPTPPLRPGTPVVVPTRLAWPRLPPGMVVRLSSRRAQRPPVTRLPARLRRSKGRPGCFPQFDFLLLRQLVWVFELLQRW